MAEPTRDGLSSNPSPRSTRGAGGATVSMRRRSPIVLGLVVARSSCRVALAAPAAPAGTPRLELRAAVVVRGDPAVRPGTGLARPRRLARVAGCAVRAPGPTRDLRRPDRRAGRPSIGPAASSSRSCPAGILEGWTGLDRFLRIDLYQDGTLVRSRVPDACLGGWQTERVDDSGPFDPTYPTGCGFNPLTLGAVWGIDQGWGSTPLLSNAFVRVPDGRYVAKVSIAPRYQDALRHRARGCRGPDRDPDPQPVRLRFLRRSRRARRHRRSAAR